LRSRDRRTSPEDERMVEWPEDLFKEKRRVNGVRVGVKHSEIPKMTGRRRREGALRNRERG
jgi:hypothetical protein